MTKIIMETNKDFVHLQNEQGRYLCNAEHPMPKDIPIDSRWSHSDAIEIDEDYGKGGGVADGDFIKYRCPHCLHTWWEELPN